jgi:hypothetical protein
MAKPPLSDQQLLDYSGEHLNYEIEMFRTTAAVLAAGGLARTDGNAYLESWVIHLRNLIEFLYQDSPRSTDITAHDFFANPGDWISARTSRTTTIDAAWTRANKEISHLTTERIAGVPPQKMWPTPLLTTWVVDELRRFQQAASTSRLHPIIATLLK